MKWMSRHRVATWLRTGQEKRCRDTDLMLRHGVAWVGVATWSWCRDMGQAACTVHCLGTVQVTVWTLFMDIVHETLFTGKRKKKEYRIFKNFLVGDFIYKIFI